MGQREILHSYVICIAIKYIEPVRPVSPSHAKLLSYPKFIFPLMHLLRFCEMAG